jgi:hypothetical protein
MNETAMIVWDPPPDPGEKPDDAASSSIVSLLTGALWIRRLPGGETEVKSVPSRLSSPVRVRPSGAVRTRD